LAVSNKLLNKMQLLIITELLASVAIEISPYLQFSMKRTCYSIIYSSSPNKRNEINDYKRFSQEESNNGQRASMKKCMNKIRGRRNKGID
jgi:hypothetical protein